MRRIIAVIIVYTIFLPGMTQARWIGDWARDYSEREETVRISRDAIALRREARLAARLRRLNTRSRWVPERTVGETPVERRMRLRRERLEQRRRLRGLRRFATTDEQREKTQAVLESARFDARRRGDMREILEVILRYVLSDDEEEFSVLPSISTGICKSRSLSCEGVLDLNEALVGRSLLAFPIDPAVSAEADGTGYFIMKTSTGGILISTPHGRNGEGMELEWEPLQ